MRGILILEHVCVHLPDEMTNVAVKMQKTNQNKVSAAKPQSCPATKTCLVMFLQHFRFIPETGVKPWGRYLVIKKLLTLVVIKY